MLARERFAGTGVSASNGSTSAFLKEASFEFQISALSSSSIKIIATERTHPNVLLLASTRISTSKVDIGYRSSSRGLLTDRMEKGEIFIAA